MKWTILLLFLAGCTPNAGASSLYSKHPVTSGPLTDATCELIDAELRWGRHVQQARRQLEDGNFRDAEHELWLAELSAFGMPFLAEQTRAERLKVRSSRTLILRDCAGEVTAVSRAR